MKQLDIVILAAGAGKRMQSSLPKVLHPLAGRPLLSHVLDTAHTLSPNQVCVVYGHGGERVKQVIDDSSLVWIRQAQQLGTGHALKQALPSLAETGNTLVLFGDVPLVKSVTLRALLEKATDDRLVMLTTELDEPSGYGRIVRDQETGSIQSIVEEKDATPAQRRIHEINTGIMVFPNRLLPAWLARLDNSNAQGEYYLTDIVEMAAADGVGIESARPANSWETIGVNNKRQLAGLERIYQQEIAHDLMAQGVTLLDPTRIDVRGQLVCGHDVEIDINCLFEGAVRLGDNVKIQAHCTLRNVT
ncbi:MAG: NTP transferase domain-containing protein, partial [Nitrosomonas halophila]